MTIHRKQLKAADSSATNGGTPAIPRKILNNGPNGQFLPGNRASVGRPNPQHAFRKDLYAALQEGKWQQILRTLLSSAIRGQHWAVKIVVEHAIGRPPQHLVHHEGSDSGDEPDLRFL